MNNDFEAPSASGILAVMAAVLIAVTYALSALLNMVGFKVGRYAREKEAWETSGLSKQDWHELKMADRYMVYRSTRAIRVLARLVMAFGLFVLTYGLVVVLLSKHAGAPMPASVAGGIVAAVLVLSWNIYRHFSLTRKWAAAYRKWGDVADLPSMN